MALLAKALGAVAWSLVTRVAMRPGAVFIKLPLAFIDSRSTNLKNETAAPGNHAFRVHLSKNPPLNRDALCLNNYIAIASWTRNSLAPA
ncbi:MULTISPECIES: hypothetical protein [Xanthomonas]|uniref:Secreted protein n=2 Tax=Xanthomonas arboricola TaxID=56448 RepID=A0AB73GYM9_9XANT|nr:MULTISPECIES: hypothetical protein [Xanthomonas]MBB5670284.1 hypothetical protein [Xanthomonas arboricola]